MNPLNADSIHLVNVANCGYCVTCEVLQHLAKGSERARSGHFQFSEDSNDILSPVALLLIIAVVFLVNAVFDTAPSITSRIAACDGGFFEVHRNSLELYRLHIVVNDVRRGGTHGY